MAVNKVLAKDEETGEKVYKEVTALHRNEKDTTYKLSIGNELVQNSGNHLKIYNIKIVHHDEKVKVYNFAVADFHTSL
ncbi:hypothetical protein PTI45_01013 [Paenibacillus nuruki]|uniref:Uncharacterized protein n=1 Tax=Paenibacillus nuruki TaxID=1886670 RepID=A0A1E3L998_9BACL|nr:polymorphic toxin-type HINT domain-containing protein [Paenibacillus nuruki]ODP29530.1 hypothetical protein PTI45_01013 [Paenibacillus nuruki]